MLREANMQFLPWTARTRSAIRSNRMDACEKWLESQPNRGLFTADTPDATDLWQLSFEGEEHPLLAHLYTRQELQKRVMLRLPAEAALLSEGEEELCERLMKERGFLPLQSIDDPQAAVGLVRRLWASVISVDEIKAIALQPPVMLSAGMVRCGSEFTQLRDQLMQICRDVDGLLYLYGVIPAQDVRIKLQQVLQDTFADDEALLNRFIRLDFDYTYAPNGEMLLVHPGLADPMSVPVCRNAWDKPHTAQTLTEASAGALGSEVPSFHRLLGLIQGALRPECDDASTVEDLAYLCKQQVPLKDVEQALSSYLIVHPSEGMLAGVRQLHQQVARWKTLHSEVLN